MAIQDITEPMALDSTLQGTNTALGLLAKDATVSAISTALGLLGKDTSIQAVVTALGLLNKDATMVTQNSKLDTIIAKLQGIIEALGVDTSIYKAAGNKACADLTSSLLVAGNLGNVYNTTDNGTTTADFVEGAGKPIHLGDNVAVVDIGEGGSHVYKFDLLSGLVDLSNYIQKSETAGLLKNDGSVDTNTYATTSQVSGKADKVSSATNGNLAGLNASGNPTDSGWNGAKDTTSISGNPISIIGLKSNQLAVNPIITLEPIQAGSGTPSPSNIRAISGYDKIEVLSCGKNLFNINKVLVGTVSNGVWTWGGSTSKLFDLKFKANTQYTFSGYQTQSGANKNVRPRIIYTDGTAENIYTSTSTTRTAFTKTSAEDKTIDYIQAYYGSDSSATVTIENFQIEESTSATTYTPYNKTTDLSESLGQMVYWGELDVRSGKFKVLGGRVDLGTIDWDIVESASSYKDFRNISMANVIKPVESQAIANGACEIFAMTSRNDQANNHPLNTIAITLNGYIRVIANASYTDATAFKTDMSGVYFVYELATPFTIQLTPHEISLLKDYAYVSTNGTSIALDYHNGELASLADVSQLGETVNALDRIQERQVQVGIKSYNSSANKYSIPFDGYITAYLPSGTGYVMVTIYDHNEQTMGTYCKYAVSDGNEYYTVFVKKGMKAMITVSSGFSPSVTYRGMA